MQDLVQLKATAAKIAEELKTAAASSSAPAATGGGSRQRGLPEELRERFIAVRSILFQRGVYDPVLVRFDTASAPQAATLEVAEQLAQLAESLV